MELIRTEKLSKKFGSVYALQDASIQIEKGKIYGLLGPNGSGKTTFMRLIAGLFYPSKGHIAINGQPISYLSKKTIAYMPTEPYFYDYMSIQNVKDFFIDFYEDFDPARFDTLLDNMGLRHQMKVTALSSGMDAKLRVALTMSRQASVYLLDEPLNGIDLVARDIIMSTIIGGSTPDNAIIISSHLIDVMENVLDDVILLKEGVVVLSDGAESAREQYKKSIVDIYKEVFA